VEFNSNTIEEFPKKVCEEMGFVPENYSFNIFARCKNIKTCKYYKERKKN
jgi:hypothetical protein